MHQLPSQTRPGTATPAQAVLTVVLALAGATLLNAQPMLETAQGLPFGARRSVAVAVMEPVADLSRALRLDEPRRSLDRALGHAPQVPSPQPSGTLSPSPVPTVTAVPSASPTVPALRVPTRADPLRIRVVGDSMAQATGQSLIALADDLEVATATLDFRFSSGLSRPDFFDWPGHLASVLAGPQPPEALVVFFGANDAQDLAIANKVRRYGTPEWDAEYASRVSAVMRQLTAAGARVYWVGQPIARPEGYSQRMKHLDAIYRREAGLHPGVRYVDSWSLFTSADGEYSDYLRTGSGLTLMRLQDGIHLTRAGGDRLAGAILSTLHEDWELRP